MLEIVRKGSAVTRITANKDRITIKLAHRDDCEEVIQYLVSVGKAIQDDASIKVTMRGTYENGGVIMADDLRSFSRTFKQE